MGIPQEEPSMEEILASIRKIIAEDSPDQTPLGDDSDVLDLTEEMAEEDKGEAAQGFPGLDVPSESEPENLNMAPHPLEENTEEGDVYTPSTVIEEVAPEQDISHAFSFEVNDVTNDAPFVDASPQEVANEILPLDESRVFLGEETAISETPERIGDTKSVANIDIDSEQQSSPYLNDFMDDEEDKHQIKEALFEKEPPMSEEFLMSEETIAASAAALSALKTAASPQGGNQTVNDLVKDILRPLLKEWLDEHLPDIVKTTVTTQIEKLVKERLC